MNKLLICLLAALSTPAIAADLNTGMAAVRAGDYTTALENFEPLARAGNPDAEYQLCGMYYLAQAVPKNDAEAAKLCRASAQQGNPDAMYNLALMYEKGEGVQQNFNEATKWYAAAASKGNPAAKYNLGQIQTAINNAARPKAIQMVQNPPPNLGALAPAAGPQMPVAPTAPVNPAAAATVMGPPAPAALMPPPMPPMPPPVPPGIAAATTAAVTAPVAAVMPVSTAESQPTIDAKTANYCLMAAQRGTPDARCASQFKPLLPADKAAPSLAPATNDHDELTEIPQPTVVKAVPPVAAPVAMTHSPSTLQAQAEAIQANNLATASGTKYVPVTPAFPPIPATALPQAPAPEPKQPSKLDYYIAQAKTGNARAQNVLGVMYRRGLNGAVTNPQEALKLFQHSASQGDTDAMINLASMYKNAEGMKQNLVIAYAWYSMAADRAPLGTVKKSRAQESQQELAQYLSGEQVGDSMQYVARLDQTIPLLDESESADVGTEATPTQNVNASAIGATARN